jgi:hypothetical protein
MTTLRTSEMVAIAVEAARIDIWRTIVRMIDNGGDANFVRFIATQAIEGTLDQSQPSVSVEAANAEIAELKELLETETFCCNRALDRWSEAKAAVEAARREARAEAFEDAAALWRAEPRWIITREQVIRQLEALAAATRAPHGDKPPAMLHEAFEPERASSTAPSAPTVMLLNPATGKFVTPDTLHTYHNGEHRTYEAEVSVEGWRQIWPDDNGVVRDAIPWPDFPVEDQPR